ncbi:MAG: hypothetical protein BWY67_00402 [Bacteroidetes bacterium ADurb.Bin397]|jgi:hypothetical protein|nr:MAG: hypothetical protein BWY67_00402 [Bacteroidetes bacterium ADurb.Bin397]
MKIISILIVLLLVSKTSSSQQSYRLQLDTMKFSLSTPIIQITADGNVICGIADNQLKILKLDVSGNLLWSKNYGNSSTGIEYGQINIIASPDSGFYINSPVEEDMFSWFSTAYIRKIDKYGNQINFIKSINSPSTGEAIRWGPVNTFSNDIYLQGVHTEYDGILDVVCCPSYYAVTLNSNLNLISKTSQTQLFNPFFTTLDSLNNTKIFGQKLIYPDSGYYQINGFDTLKNLNWERRFYYDTTLVRSLLIKDYEEFNGDRYIVLMASVNSQNRLCIHKLNANWETTFFKILDPTVIFPGSGTFGSLNMGILSNGRIIISGTREFIGNSNNTILLELDTAGNAVHSWRSSDGYYFYFQAAVVDGSDGSALFLRRTNDPGTKFIQIERQYPDAPNCNYVPYPLNPMSIVIIDSVFSNNMTALPSMYPYLGVDFSNPPSIYNPLVAPICGILSSNFNTNNLDHCEDLFLTYATNKLITLNSTCNSLDNSSIKLFDIRGRLLFNQNVNSIDFPMSIPVNNLNPGMYIISTVLNTNKVINLKFVVD